MTQSTAEIYRQKENSSLTQTARFIFSRLMKNCEVLNLGDVLNDIKTGKTPSKNEKKYYEDEFIDWFKPNEIGDKKYLENAAEKLSKFAYDKGQVTVYKPNSILINAIGDIGRIAILKHKASSNQQITGIELNEEKLLTEYCYYYLLANRHHFYKDLFQTTLPIVNQKKIRQIPIPIPGLIEQKRIVAFLNKLENINNLEALRELTGFEDLISLAEKFYILKNKNSEISVELTHQLSLVKQLRQALLREAMQGKLTEEWRTSSGVEMEPASVLLEKIKAEKEQLIREKKIKKEKTLPPISEEETPFEIPENWVITRIGEVCTKVTDGFHHTPRKLQEGVIYISATNIREYGIDWDNCQFIPQKEHDELYKKAYPQKGEILITNRGAGCATPAIIDIDDSFSFQNAALIGFNQSFLSNRFIYYFILKNRDDIMEYFVNGGLQPMLSNVTLSKIPLPLPPLSEQQRIVTKLDELMKLCDDLEASIKESQQQNELLLQQVLREALEPGDKNGEI